MKDGPFSTEEEARAKHGGILPLNTKLIKGAARGDASTGWLLVTRTPVVRGSDLRDAQADRRARRARGKHSSFSSQEAGRRFERYTEANVGNRLAIVLDNQWRLAPTINSKIGDTGMITNMGGQQDASDTALVLRAGSLPASLVYLQESTVGPSLGADSIRQGFIAGLVGIVAVVLVHAALLQEGRHQRDARAAAERVDSDCGARLFRRGADAARHRGCDSDDRYGGRQQRADFRAHSRRAAGRQGGRRGRRDAGSTRRFVTIIDTHVTTVVSCAVPVPVRNRSGEGVRGHAGDRSGRQRVHGGVRVEVHLRLGDRGQAPGHDPEYLSAGSRVVRGTATRARLI